MDDYKDMFADLASFEPAEVIRQMQEKQKEEEATRLMWEKHMAEESNLLSEEQTMPAAEAAPEAREEKKKNKNKRQNDKPSTQTLQRVRISITESDMNKMRCLLMLPDSSIRKCLREAVSKCIKEQYDKHKKQLKEMLSEK